jgi:hypothetical protein
MENFPPNSKSGRGPTVPEEPKKIERVTSTEATRRPKSLGRRFKDTFIGGDMKSAMHYSFVDVVVPAIQDTLIDAFQGGVERLIRGDSARPRRSVPGGYNNLGHVDYSRMSRGPAPATRSPQSQRMLSRGSRARGSFDELIIPSRREAEEVIDRMFDILSQYGQVSVSHLYELTGIQSSHTDIKWGWTQLRGAKAVPLRGGGGYLLDLPEPEPFH